MRKLVHQCAPWLTGKTVGIIALTVVGFIACTGLPTLGVLAGAAPLLLVVACLAPLALLRRRNRS